MADADLETLPGGHRPEPDRLVRRTGDEHHGARGHPHLLTVGGVDRGDPVRVAHEGLDARACKRKKDE